MKSKRVETEARRISLGLVKDVLENIFEKEIEAAQQEINNGTGCKRKLEELETISLNTRPRRTRTKAQYAEIDCETDKNQGVFTTSDAVVKEIPKLGTRIKADNVSMVMESNKSILESLPVIEKLRSLSRSYILIGFSGMY